MLGKLASSFRRSSRSKRSTASSRSRRNTNTTSSHSPTTPRPLSSHGDGSNAHLHPPAASSRRRARSYEAERRRPNRFDHDDHFEDDGNEHHHYRQPYPLRRSATRRRSPSPPPLRREPTLKDSRRLRRRSTRDGSISADEDSRPLSPDSPALPRYPMDRTTGRGRDRPAYHDLHSARPGMMQQYPPDSYPYSHHRPIDRRRMSYDSSYAMRPGAAAVAFKSSSPGRHGQFDYSHPDFPRSSPKSRSREDTRRSRHADVGSPTRPSPTRRSTADSQAQRPHQKPRPKPSKSEPRPRPRPSSSSPSGSPTEHSAKDSATGDFWERFPRTLATFTGLRILTDHANTAKEWADWLNDLQGAPAEIQALSAEATTAKDTIYQIQHSLEARPDLVEGESGQILKKQIESAIKSTDESLEKMTNLLQEVGDDGTEGAVWKGLQDFYSSYRYKSQWEDKIKEAEADLQTNLGTLAALMSNIYSRALTKPVPLDSTTAVAIPPSSRANIEVETPVTSPPVNRDQGPWTGSGAKLEDISNIHVRLPPESDTLKNAPPVKTTIEPNYTSIKDQKIPLLSEGTRGETRVDNEQATKTGPTAPPPQAAQTREDSKVEPPKVNKGENISSGTEPPAADTPAKGTATADPQPEPGVHDDHQIALLDAAWNGDLTSVARELEHTSVMTRDLQGLTPLHLAVERDHLATAMLLRDHQAVFDASDGKDRTPLHLAARFASAATVEFLLDKGRSNPNARNADGRTPLHYAATVAVDGDEERREVLRVLRDYGANPFIFDNRRNTPRDLAQQRDCWDAAATLSRAEKAWEKKGNRRTRRR